MIDKKLIENRIENFFGYGNLQSKIWFVGMEEGFNGNLNDLEVRFNKTEKYNVVDIFEGMNGIKDHLKWFYKDSKIQKTWDKLIKILFSIDGKKIDKESIRNFQINNFCRNNSNHCNLVFMPLPCKSINQKDWFYKDFGIDYLYNRKIYLNTFFKKRIEKFNKLLINNKPEIIIFYSLTYLKQWKEIIGNKILKKSDYLYFSSNNNIKFFIIPHPASHGMKNEDWINIFNKIKALK